MTHSLLVLGRQPELGLAELESLYGTDRLQPLGTAALLDVDPAEVHFASLGGSLKLGKLLTVLDTTDSAKIEQALRKALPQHLQHLPDGKLKLGLSAYGFTPRELSPARLNAMGLTLKKVAKHAGRSARVVPNNEQELNSAQVLHNNLTGPTGYELLLVRHRQQTWLAQTTAVQDIDAYAARDQGRPKRDARVGMLPPKLAQILINLAAGPQPPNTETIVLDPFCGTGVVLQEALLMGYSAYGTDLEPRMIDFSTKNLEWLAAQHQLAGSVMLEQGDATTHQWQQPIDLVVCETYLGRPFAALPDAETLARTVSDCNLIIRKFLANLAPQLPAGTRLCVAVPAWQIKPGQFKQLPLIDHLSELGYNRVSFEHTGGQDLRYYRADQTVARELLVITKH